MLLGLEICPLKGPWKASRCEMEPLFKRLSHLKDLEKIDRKYSFCLKKKIKNPYLHFNTFIMRLFPQNSCCECVSNAGLTCFLPLFSLRLHSLQTGRVYILTCLHTVMNWLESMFPSSAEHWESMTSGFSCSTKLPCHALMASTNMTWSELERMCL